MSSSFESRGRDRLKSKVLNYPTPTGYSIQSQAASPNVRVSSREEVILHYTPLIKYIAHRLAMRLPAHISAEDLISAGLMGLMDALTKFDPDKNVAFKTYAEFRIRGAMLDELRSLDWVPRSVRQKAAHLERTLLHLEKKMGRPAEDEEIAHELSLSLEKYYDLLNEVKGISILDEEVLERKMGKLPGEDISDLLLNEGGKDPFHELSLKELKKALASMIDELSPKEKLVISLYHYEELTLKEIGEALDLTESRICQIHTKGILRLRGKLKRYLKDAL
jgi:RNA polymerase sigma factor for flagellar operon FliA